MTGRRRIRRLSSLTMNRTLALVFFNGGNTVLKNSGAWGSLLTFACYPSLPQTPRQWPSNQRQSRSSSMSAGLRTSA